MVIVHQFPFLNYFDRPSSLSASSSFILFLVLFFFLLILVCLFLYPFSILHFSFQSLFPSSPFAPFLSPSCFVSFSFPSLFSFLFIYGDYLYLSMFLFFLVFIFLSDFRLSSCPVVFLSSAHAFADDPHFPSLSI